MSRDILVEILKQEVRPAVGCTEPGAIAYTAALAAERCNGEIVAVEIRLSPGVFKNGYAVGIPGTGEKGIALAAALGVIIKDAAKELEILKNLSQEQVQRAKELMREGLVLVACDWDMDGIYVRARVQTIEDTCIVVVRGGHTRVESIETNGEAIFLSEDRLKSLNHRVALRSQKLAGLLAKAQSLPPERLEFLLEGLMQNYKVAEEGLCRKAGIGVGYGLNLLIEEEIIHYDLTNRARSVVAAAADARMDGIDLPVSTSFGSGNQGLLTSLAIGEAAAYLQVSQEQLVRALAIGHLVNGYAKESTGKISPLCGCSIAAGLGVTAAVSWLLGNDWAGISGAMNNLLGNITGMVCDGAKGGCAFKLATSAGEALLAALLAKKGICIQQPEGVVAGTIEDSIRNLGLLGRTGMANLDRTMLGFITKQETAI